MCVGSSVMAVVCLGKYCNVMANCARMVSNASLASVSNVSMKGAAIWLV